MVVSIFGPLPQTLPAASGPGSPPGGSSSNWLPLPGYPTIFPRNFCNQVGSCDRILVESFMSLSDLATKLSLMALTLSRSLLLLADPLPAWIPERASTPSPSLIMPDGVQVLWGNSFYWIKWLRLGGSSFRAVGFVLQCVTHMERARGESRIQFQILPMGHNPSRELGSISGLDICLALHLLAFLYIAFFLFSCSFSSFEPSSDQISQILGRGEELVPAVTPQRVPLRPLPGHCVDSPAPDSTLMLGQAHQPVEGGEESD